MPSSRNSQREVGAIAMLADADALAVLAGSVDALLDDAFDGSFNS